MAQGRVIGWDMNAVLAMGNALGVSAAAVAELMPEMEPVMVREMNSRIQAGSAET